jgi:hypothetical protein
MAMLINFDSGHAIQDSVEALTMMLNEQLTNHPNSTHLELILYQDERKS